MTFLRFMYHTAPGRLLIRPLCSRNVSRLAGRYLDSSLSKWLIPGFVKRADINLSEFESDSFRCFNDCFTRKIKDGLRPVDGGEDALVAPCDGLLSAYRIEKDTVLPVKQSRYTVESLLRDETLAQRYRDGVCLVFRLCVEHYHRYCYPVSGQKSDNRFIPGMLHSVRPVVLEKVAVFTENCREYTTYETSGFGKVTQIEVGAMLVGKIKNHMGCGTVKKGDEKGMFLYGGSTVILLLEKDSACFPEIFFEKTKAGEEIPVRLGQRLNV